MEKQPLTVLWTEPAKKAVVLEIVKPGRFSKPDRFKSPKNYNYFRFR